jgi:hypothetical protein
MGIVFYLIIFVAIVFGSMLFWDIVTKLLSDKDPNAQSYWFSFFEDGDEADKPKF